MGVAIARAQRPHSAPNDEKPASVPVALFRAAELWLRATRDVKEIQAARDKLAAILKKGMRQTGIPYVGVGAQAVALVTSRKKSFTKEFLVKTMGRRQGEELWKLAPESISEYLSAVDVLKSKRR